MKVMSKIYSGIATLFLAGAVSFSSCVNNQQTEDNTIDSVKVADENRSLNAEPREGDLCSVVKDSTGRSFGIVKILKIEGDIYHIRTYGVSYESRPSENDVKDIKPNHSAGIGHLPISRQQFTQWKPEVILNQPVSLEELEGYNIWKNGQK